MAKEREAKGANDTNAQIITTDSGRIYKPVNLLSAISEIQQFYVIESKGQNIPAEFLTLERTIDFFKIGLKSGFNEGVVGQLAGQFGQGFQGRGGAHGFLLTTARRAGTCRSA